MGEILASHQAQRLVLNCTTFSWQLVTCCMPEGLVLQLILFILFINHLSNGAEVHTQEVQTGESGW